MKGSWSNANKIIARKGVGNAHSVANARVLVSNTSAGFHHASLVSKGCPVKCNSTRFEKLHLCAHLLAVAYYEKCLSDVIRNYQTNISSLVKPLKKAGKKPNLSVSKRRAPSDYFKMFPSTVILLMMVTFPPHPLQNGMWSSHKDEEILSLQWTCEAKCKLRTSIPMEHRLHETCILNIHASHDKFLEDFHEEGKC